jgi:hypothetical protein
VRVHQVFDALFHVGQLLRGGEQRHRNTIVCMILTQFKERIELCRILATVQSDVADDLGRIAEASSAESPSR